MTSDTTTVRNPWGRWRVLGNALMTTLMARAVLMTVLVAVLVTVLTGCNATRRSTFYASCLTSSECESALCSEGICTYPCTANSDCGVVGYCDGKVCRPDYRCTADAQSGDASDAASADPPCRLIPPQCGCPNGQACYIPNDSPVCLPAGQVVDGGVCAVDNDCHGGAACVTGLPTGPQCQTLCDPSAPQTCASGVCTPSGIPGLGACMVVCDLVAQTGCGTQQCYAIGQKGGGYVATCGKLPGTKTEGATCAGLSDCAAGYLCANSQCRRVCHLGSATECTVGSCKEATPAFVVGKTTYGVCIP